MLLDCGREVLTYCAGDAEYASGEDVGFVITAPAGMLPSSTAVSDAGVGASPDPSSLAIVLSTGHAPAAAASAPAKPVMKPVLFSADTVDWPAGHDESKLTAGFLKVRCLFPLFSQRVPLRCACRSSLQLVFLSSVSSLLVCCCFRGNGSQMPATSGVMPLLSLRKLSLYAAR